MIDYYAILGVERTATTEEISKAFRNLARTCHPDKFPDQPEKEEQFRELSSAYTILSDPEKREEYDKKMSASHDFDFYRTMFNGEEIDNPSAADFTHDYIKPELPKGDDITLPITLSLQELFDGTTKVITLTKDNHCRICDGSGAKTNKKCTTCKGKGKVKKVVTDENGKSLKMIPCPNCYGSCVEPDVKCEACDGTGKHREETIIKVNIPTGFDPKDVLKVSGKGQAGNRGGPYGDLLLQIRQEPNTEYIRVGSNIFQDIEVTITDLVLGTTIEVETLRNPVSLNIPPLTQPNTKYKIPKYGIFISDEEIGDHFIRLRLTLPEVLSDEQKDLYQKLRDSEFTDIIDD